MSSENVFFIPNDMNKLNIHGRRFLFDTNIWMILYPPIFYDPKDYKVKNYSGLTKKIIDEGGEILVDILVVAEYVNRYLRDNYKNTVKDPIAKPYKIYRQSEEYADSAKNVSDELFQILNGVTRIQLNFATFDMDAVVAEFSGLGVDFNDAIYARLCQSENACLVTDDGDCCFRDIPVVTGNKTLAKKLTHTQ